MLKGVMVDVSVVDGPGPGAATLVLCGELDLATTAVLDQQVDALVAGGRSRLTVDASGLTFCDSVGLNGLVRAKNRCDAAGGWLRVSGPHGQVAQVIGISGLVDALSVDAASTDDAR
jgi:anti-anti-sigma factor